MSLSGIRENVMNKLMLSAYEPTPIGAFELWRQELDLTDDCLSKCRRTPIAILSKTWADYMAVVGSGWVKPDM